MDNNDLHHHTPLIVVVFVLIVSSAIVFLWYLKSYTPRMETVAPESAMEPSETSTEANVTGEVEVKTVEEAPVVNPIEGAYTNPF